MKLWSIQKTNVLPSDKTLDKIKNILFPPFRLLQKKGEDGETIKYHIDHSVTSNLDVIYSDLQEGINDKHLQEGIADLLARLERVRELLDIHSILDKDAQYIIIDNLYDDSTENITMADDGYDRT